MQHVYVLMNGQIYEQIHTYVHTYIHTSYTRHTHTFNVVTFDTGTNFPAVSRNSLLAVAMMNIRHR